MYIPAKDGKRYETVCIAFELLSGYLFTINPCLYSGERAEKINVYRSECCKVLHKHFYPAKKEAVKLPNLNLSDEEYTAHLIRAAGLLQTEIVAHETTKHRLIENA